MGLFDLFKKKKTMTLDEVVRKMKKEGYSNAEIKEKLIGEVSGKVLSGLGTSNERIEKRRECIKRHKNNPPISNDEVVLYRWVIGKCDFDDDIIEDILEERGKDFINKDGVCIDCFDRKDEIGTMEYFETIGLPQSGFSMCYTGCGCRLEKYKEGKV